MLSKLKKIISSFIFKNQDSNEQAKYEFLKWLYLAGAFSFIIGTYSIIRPLKTSVFLGLVGKEYQPITKIISIAILFPCLILYTKLVDKLRRYQVVYFFFILYSIGCVIAALLLMHPTIGLSNTMTSPNRIFGWIFYLFIELYSSLIVSTFWAFASSICSPTYAQENYGKIVAVSRVAGIATPLLSWLVMRKLPYSCTVSIPMLLIASAVFLLLACLCIAKIMKEIPGYMLHGYEAVYKSEKTTNHQKTGLFEGLKLILTQPYVFGIFTLVYIYEALSAITDYQMQVLMSVEKQNAVDEMSCFMFIYTATFQALGLIFAYFGTSALLEKIGVRYCILIMPLATILFMAILFTSPNLTTIFIIMVLLRAAHYGFNVPVREILYIPTTKDVKFKSKAWIESFGRSLSKTSGATFNFISQLQNPFLQIRFNSVIAIGISVFWAGISIFIGKKYEKTIKDNAIIGTMPDDKMA
jgi:ATP:ADP antiporter, AAA family